MKLTIDIPPQIDETLRRQYGSSFGRAAKEALAIAWYHDEKLSLGQFAELLEISIHDAEGLLKSRGIASTYSTAELSQDRQTLERLLQS
jgi:predicted HTH domain antitoxin